MPNERNKKLVKEIKEKIETANSITFTDYAGISADQANALRQKVKDAGGEVLVAKNTLFKAAIDENGDKSITDAKKDLEGPTMTIFGFKDPILPIKALFEFAKNIDLPKVKSAIIEGIYNSAEKVSVIKTIPSKEELLTKIVSSMNSPISGFVNTISGVQRKFIFAVNAIAKKKTEGGAN
ncbi:50S ribosomal protein L10 [candidate division WWE3 bacterium]|uniref:Large ribosomal subunit protein uL10 n=1 Tax=candidate division WWE3 bacterium TaxID=2053526 RepID=A0A7X9HU05_UNCKA|nr:50S ribosomal protein L10 [candidate division WWE3 bacterium]